MKISSGASRRETQGEADQREEARKLRVRLAGESEGMLGRNEGVSMGEAKQPVSGRKGGDEKRRESV